MYSVFKYTGILFFGVLIGISLSYFMGYFPNVPKLNLIADPNECWSCGYGYYKEQGENRIRVLEPRYCPSCQKVIFGTKPEFNEFGNHWMMYNHEVYE